MPFCCLKFNEFFFLKKTLFIYLLIEEREGESTHKQGGKVEIPHRAREPAWWLRSWTKDPEILT